MKTNKVLLGTVAGGVAFFLLGWLVYGIMLKDFMASNYNNCMMRGEMDFIWWALIVSNFVWALTYSIIIDWSNMRSLMGGLRVGLIIGFLVTLSFDLSFYSMSTMYNSMSTLCVDIIIGSIFSAVGGAVIGQVMGMGKTEAAA